MLASFPLGELLATSGSVLPALNATRTTICDALGRFLTRVMRKRRTMLPSAAFSVCTTRTRRIATPVSLPVPGMRLARSSRSSLSAFRSCSNSLIRLAELFAGLGVAGRTLSLAATTCEMDDKAGGLSSPRMPRVARSRKKPMVAKASAANSTIAAQSQRTLRT